MAQYVPLEDFSVLLHRPSIILVRVIRSLYFQSYKREFVSWTGVATFLVFSGCDVSLFWKFDFTHFDIVIWSSKREAILAGLGHDC
jgi:hypothetical protein